MCSNNHDTYVWTGFQVPIYLYKLVGPQTMDYAGYYSFVLPLTSSFISSILTSSLLRILLSPPTLCSKQRASTKLVVALSLVLRLFTPLSRFVRHNKHAHAAPSTRKTHIVSSTKDVQRHQMPRSRSVVSTPACSAGLVSDLAKPGAKELDQVEIDNRHFTGPSLI
ncbi:hypothetical protein SODALDRAFT_329752 [Sodiomyces alkalinus F11]|uniref:Uncharacterized protein n=1 Tax=Sodiomyces alkalinus (strain CBS 110278 / VKM F-3762 / F11) TaxID=1314773 RepID=A0A3N2PIX9_SODAK|nr:hypothetical protein SODALDRAFT_329752 [Sodiomyces alkalinus F11]ROT34498.1 hypothetical protein SODALDRAFT_329752 [Sodiomyces alkalinus F11]